LQDGSQAAKEVAENARYLRGPQGSAASAENRPRVSQRQPLRGNIASNARRGRALILFDETAAGLLAWTERGSKWVNIRGAARHIGQSSRDDRRVALRSREVTMRHKGRLFKQKGRRRKSRPTPRAGFIGEAAMADCARAATISRGVRGSDVYSALQALQAATDARAEYFPSLVVTACGSHALQGTIIGGWWRATADRSEMRGAGECCRLPTLHRSNVLVAVNVPQGRRCGALTVDEQLAHDAGCGGGLARREYLRHNSRASPSARQGGGQLSGGSRNVVRLRVRCDQSAFRIMTAHRRARALIAHRSRDAGSPSGEEGDFGARQRAEHRGGQAGFRTCHLMVNSAAVQPPI